MVNFLSVTSRIPPQFMYNDCVCGISIPTLELILMAPPDAARKVTSLTYSSPSFSTSAWLKPRAIKTTPEVGMSAIVIARISGTSPAICSTSICFAVASKLFEYIFTSPVLTFPELPESPEAFSPAFIPPRQLLFQGRSPMNTRAEQLFII